MTKTMNFLLVMIMIFCNNLSGQVNDDPKIPDGYYYGNDHLFTNVFVNVSYDTAFVDIIFIQKYPRDIISDTLFYNNDDLMFVGKITKILLHDGEKYIHTIEESTVFGKKFEIQLNSDEAYYKDHIDKYKNYASWYQCYSEFLMKHNKGEARKYFRELEKKNDVKLIMDTCSYKDFVRTMNRIKKELNSFE